MSNIDAMLQAAQSNAQAAVQSQPVTIDATPQYQPVQQQAQQAQYQPQQAQQAQYQQPVQQQAQQPQYQQPQQAQYQQPVQQQAQQPQYPQQPQQAQYQQPVQQAQYPAQAQQGQYLPQQAQQAQMPQQYQQQPMQAQLPAHLLAMAGNAMELSMAKFMEMGLAVDIWLKPDYAGMSLGDDPTPIVSLDVQIDMTEKQGYTPIWAIRYSENPVRYDYSLDCVTSKDGAPWLQVLSQAYAIDPKVNPYKAVQIPMTLLAEAVNLKNEVVAKTGTRIGYTTPVTGFNAFASLYSECQQKGWLNTRVVVRLTNEGKLKNGNKWGLIKFELLGQANQPQQQTA